MNILMTNVAKAICIAALLTVLLVIAGCAEIQPIRPPNHREEGPAKGLFTGSQGAWVITLPEPSPAGGEEDKNAAADAETERRQKKNPDESADSPQQ